VLTAAPGGPGSGHLGRGSEPARGYTGGVRSGKAKRVKKARSEEPAVRIRPGTARDIPTILTLIRALAKYERLTPYLELSPRRLRRDGFGQRRYFDSLICTRAGRPVGYAIYYFAYSSFTCSPVLFLEDIFVLPGERGKGMGKAMMSALARIAVRRECTQMEWVVLDWNAPSIGFYGKLGARLDRPWVLTRLTGDRLRRLAARP
jgi:GNAT superfamily N-acetyltransferase